MTSERDTVILLHGLGRSARAMWRLAFELRKQYAVINKTYPSRRYSIERLSELVVGDAMDAYHKLGAGNGKVHFVTHSMGGILLRHYLAHHNIENLGRTVMLGPPNQGSELSDMLTRFSVTEKVMGPASMQMSTSEKSIPNQLGAVNFELGVIAGTKSSNPLLAKMVDGENDGKVSVESSKVPGMTDHLVLPVTHTFMMQNKDVIEQVKYFLQHGEFSRKAL